MVNEDIAALRRDFTELRKDVIARLEVIGGAVERLASRVYIPGPSVWKRLGCWLGLVRLG
jgi:hypothetical protein